jgi:hypothetical protein
MIQTRYGKTSTLSQVGIRCHNTVNVAQLNSLAPHKWLQGTILSAYLNLLGNEVYVHNEGDKNPPKMAVFDNLFLDTIEDWDEEYNYRNARASGMKRLRGRCPSNFEVLCCFFATKLTSTISIWLSTPNYG